LSLAIPGVSHAKVYDVVAKLSSFFKSLKLEDSDQLELQITTTLYEMEKVFLPSFFDVMVHLCVLLVREEKLCGPVQYQWMYLIERHLIFCHIINYTLYK